MNKPFIDLLLTGLLGALGAGCSGDPCEDASDICGGGEDGGENASDDVEVECEGAVKCQSECIVDADSCDVTGDSALQDCIANCGGAAEGA
jgi:hypothetical protein